MYEKTGKSKDEFRITLRKHF